jgi:hypothetical protein
MQDNLAKRTVFLLGAGASKALFGLPTIAEFSHGFNPSTYPNLAQFISEFFPLGQSGQKEVPFDLEELVTAIELRRDRVGSFGAPPSGFIADARRELVTFVYDALHLTNLPGSADALLEAIGLPLDDYANEPKAGFSVLTLNYDLGIETLLLRHTKKDDIGKIRHGTLIDRTYTLLGRTQLIHGDRPSLYWQHRRSAMFLKLHGSVDWLFCPSSQCGNHQLFFPNWLDTPEVHDQPGLPCSLCGTPIERVIVPPSLHKSFDMYPKLGLLWNLAYRELADAVKIILVGVSFAPSDYNLRWLVRAACAVSSDSPRCIDIL